MTENLKPCPFCGRVNMQQVKCSRRWGYFVSCSCNAVGPSRRTKNEAIDAWNTRAEQTCKSLYPHLIGTFMCSECGFGMNYPRALELLNYCPNCGAKVVDA